MNLILKLYALIGAIGLFANFAYATDNDEIFNFEIQPMPPINLSDISQTVDNSQSNSENSSTTQTTDQDNSSYAIKSQLTTDIEKVYNEYYYKDVTYTFHQATDGRAKPKKNKALKNLSKALCNDEEKPVYLITVTAPLQKDYSVYDFTRNDHTKPLIEQSAITKESAKGYMIMHDIGFILQYLCNKNKPEGDVEDLLKLRSDLDGCAKLVLFNEFFFGRGYESNYTWMHTIYPYIDCDNTLFYMHSAFIENLGDSSQSLDDQKRHSYFTSGQAPSLYNKQICTNVTYSLYNNVALTYYEKASFCREFNGYDAGYKYGCGYDLPTQLDDTFKTEHILNLQKTLLENVGTEICFDLYCKVRRMNNWSNDGGKTQIGLLLLQSGIIDPVGKVPDSSDSKNINNLPVSTVDRDIYILHADASSEPPVGSHLFKIDSTGGPIFYEPYCTIDLSQRCSGLKVTIYKVD